MSIRCIMKTAGRRWLKMFHIFKNLRSGRFSDEKPRRVNKIEPQLNEHRLRNYQTTSESHCKFPAPSPSRTPPFPRYLGKTWRIRSFYENVNVSHGYDSAYDSDELEFIEEEENDTTIQENSPIACESIKKLGNTSCEKFENIWNETIESLVL